MSKPSEPPTEGTDDLSAFEAEAPAADFVIGSDDEALRKIKRGTSPAGRIGAIAFVVLLAVLGYWAFQTSVEYDGRMDRLKSLHVAAMCGSEPNTDACYTNEEFDTELISILQEARYDDIRQRALKNLGYRKVASAVPLIAEQLKYAGGVRADAAWALATIGSPGADSAKDALFAVLPETDETDRNRVLWALAVLRDDRAANDILGAFSQGLLQSQDGFEPRIIAEVLGPARLSSEDLLNHEEESVRILTAHALTEASASPEVVDPLSRMLGHELARSEEERSNEVIRACAAGLGRSGDPAAAAPLFDLMQQMPAFRTDVLDALQRSTGAPGLATLLGEAQDLSIRRDLVRLIAAARDGRPEVVNTLAGLLNDQDTEIRTTAAFALAELGDRRATPVLLSLVEGEDTDEASLALDALRNVAAPDLTEPLRTLLSKEEMTYYRAQILRVLGKTGDPTAASAITPHLEGDDMRAAAMALADLGDEATFDRLLDIAERPRDTEMTATHPAERLTSLEELRSNRLAAIQALGRYGRPECVETMTTIVEDPLDDYELRAEAAATIGLSGTDDDIRTVLGKVQDTEVDEYTRRYYVQALGQKPRPELNPALLDVIASQAATAIRRAAAVSVGYSGDESTSGRLMEMLDDDHTRAEAAIAIVLGGSDEAAGKLLRILETDGDLRNVLTSAVNDQGSDRFNLITEDMFESGQIWRRLRVSEILSEGRGEFAFALPWEKTIAVLQSGWDGANGASVRYIRDRLWQGLTGENEEHRRVAAQAMVQIPERGLLLRARDEAGPAQEIARQTLSRAQD